MCKLFIKMSVVLICFSIVSTIHAGGAVTKEQVVDLVEKVSADMGKDAPGTLQNIINAVHPYKNKDNPAFYTFVYDVNVKIVAHPKKSLVGRIYKGKPDVKGKKFRDDIVAGALKNGTGWVNYSYQKPGEKGIHKKTTYYMLVSGSDGKQYIICCGKYL